MNSSNHGPRVLTVFDADAVSKLRTQILEMGVRGLVHEMDTLLGPVRSNIESVSGISIDKNTFKVRIYPEEKDGLGLHVDLDYVLRYMQPPTKCLSCREPVNTNSPGVKQAGLHWRPKCRKPPQDPNVFTLAVNLSETAMSIVSFAERPAQKVAHNNKADLHVVPVVNSNVPIYPCILKPGQGVLFSAWMIHKSSDESLQGTRISIDMRGWSLPTPPPTSPPPPPFAPHPSVLVTYLPVSKDYDGRTSTESHNRLLYITSGLKTRGVGVKPVLSTHLSLDFLALVQRAFRIVHPDQVATKLPANTLGVPDGHYYGTSLERKRTEKAVYEAIVTVCYAVLTTVTYKTPTFAAVHPPGHHARAAEPRACCWRNNILVAAMFSALLLPGSTKNLFIFDMDYSHGGGIEEIVLSGPFRRYCKDKGLRVLYYSVYRQGEHDSSGDWESPAPDEVISALWKDDNEPTRVVRRYSSKNSGPWGAVDTQNRLNETGQFLEQHAHRFDALFVAAGFGHFQSEVLVGVPKEHLWSDTQVQELGSSIKRSGATCNSAALGKPIVCLEGGYLKTTLKVGVPLFLEAVGIIPKNHSRTDPLAGNGDGRNAVSDGGSPTAGNDEDMDDATESDMDDATESDTDVSSYMQKSFEREFDYDFKTP